MSIQPLVSEALAPVADGAASDTAQPVIQVHELTKTFRDLRRGQVMAVDQIKHLATDPVAQLLL